MTATALRPAHRRLQWLLATVVAGLLGLQVLVAPPAAATATAVTYQGSTYPTAGPSPTEDKPQSKLWYTDGSWWALMRVSSGVTIHRLLSDHTWQDTGVLVDERLPSTGDALWDSGKLYVASRTSGGAMRAIRFSYDPATDTYSRDFSKQVGSNGTESISIARDTTGKLWVAYEQGNRIYVAHSTTSDTEWSAPFLVPVSDNTVASDDIAGIVAFSGKIGVMWSDQDNDVMRFAVHPDTAAPTSGWTMENALSGSNMADDHLNLKSLTDDNQGRLFAAVKTSQGDGGEPGSSPSIVVLKRAADGTWTNATAAQVVDKLTRPQIALDTTNDRLHVLMSTESGGTVYHKATGMGSLSFGTGKGTPFVQWSGASINDPTTTKQPVNATTGLVVLASDDDAKRYYHGEMALGSSTDTTAPSVPTGVSATASSPTSATVTWTASTDAVGVTGYDVYRDGRKVGTSTTTSYSDSGLTASTTYSYTVAAYDAAGNVSAQSAPASVTTPAGTTEPVGAISYVGAATAEGAGTSTTVAGPAGTAAGDLLVAAVSVRGAPTITPPAGWTLVRMDANSTTMRQALYYKVATGSDSSTWTLSKAFGHVVQVLAYRGVDGASPVVASAGQLSSSTTISHPSAASVAGSRVVTIAGIARTATLAPASPLVERAEVTTSSAATYKVTADSADTTVEGTTSGAFTTTANGSAGGIGQTVTLRPGA